MGIRAGRIVVPLLILLGGPLAGAALASGPAGADPSSNYAIGAMPRACETAPTGSVCIAAAVTYLDQARANLGQPPYSLPADFASLSPGQQALILTNEDRVLYNLPPVSGLTNALDQDAAAGVATDSDPEPSSSDDWYGFTSNAAWGDVNMVAAYEGWMYDDGPGSDNVDCTSSDASGCWGHRHDILWGFGPGTLAMGAASGTDSSGNPAYTMLLMQGSPAYNPVFTYTWAQALADGAGSSGGSGSTGSGAASTVSPSGGSTRPDANPEARGARVMIKVKLVRVRGHRVTVRVVGPSGTGLSCSLHREQRHFRRVKACTHTVTFSHLPAGRYQLRISSGAVTVTRGVRVR
jgi:hypothetical protein